MDCKIIWFATDQWDLKDVVVWLLLLLSLTFSYKTTLACYSESTKSKLSDLRSRTFRLRNLMYRSFKVGDIEILPRLPDGQGPSLSRQRRICLSRPSRIWSCFKGRLRWLARHSESALGMTRPQRMTCWLVILNVALSADSNVIELR